MLQRPFALPFRGELTAPGDGGYDQRRGLYNGLIDKRPALIAHCTATADVVAALAYGREAGLPIAIRGGGHNGGGLGSCDDGLVIDLSGMKGVRVDPRARTARVAAGCLQGEVDHATHVYGLAVPSGIFSTTGISGLTLGGGTGHLSRAFGLTLDNLLEADVVLADGRIVTASEDREPDLFWALRGGGGNFGIVTSFLFRAHPVSTVFGGPVFWDIAHAGAVLRRYRDRLPAAPEALGLFFGIKTVPPVDMFPEHTRGRRVCVLIACYNGPEDEARLALAPFRRGLPDPLIDATGPIPFPSLQAMFDPLLPPGLHWYWKGDFFEALSDEVIDIHLAHAARIPTNYSLMHLYPIDGAVQRVPPRATAWSRRHARWSMVIAGIDTERENAEAITRWAKDYWADLHPHSDGGGYVNFLMGDEGADRVAATYGENYDRLRRVKAVYDPQNLFRINQNIPPAVTH
ncbi:oxidoreductase [Acuticoccus sediminis]|uniref:Oxidoreductase n=1 Tax=Acuticoccus sediminis TaxID=2184697 RepID=A0A8B2NPB1_9HYPH|nr:FAD-binding oxidoreductase [Acuticoccus sediminis]RAI00109.1 oxidoreductase [Acuticoccus sediminis]